MVLYCRRSIATKKGSAVSHLPDFLIAYSYSLAPLVILSQTSTSSFLSAHRNPFQDSISSSSVYGSLGYIRSIKIRVRNLFSRRPFRPTFRYFFYYFLPSHSTHSGIYSRDFFRSRVLGES